MLEFLEKLKNIYDNETMREFVLEQENSFLLDKIEDMENRIRDLEKKIKMLDNIM